MMEYHTEALFRLEWCIFLSGMRAPVWVTPVRCCIVKYIEKTESGGL